MKKGMMVGQIFIYILALVVIALILGYGYKAIVNIKDRADRVSVIKFENDLKNKIEALSTQYKSERISTFILPVEVQTVCFADLDKGKDTRITQQSIFVVNKIDGKDNPYKDTVAYDAWISGDSNVFFFPPNVDSLRVPQIAILDRDNGAICVKVQGGQIKLKLEGIGKKTQISLAD